MITDEQLSSMSFNDLMDLLRRVEDRVDAMRKAESAKALEKVKEMIRAYQLTAVDVFGRHGRASGAGVGAGGSKVAPKYRDPATGATWTGRGKSPRWLDGKNKDDYRIADPA